MEDSKESRLRAEFEAWFSDGGEYPLACQRAKDGGYMLAQAESSWTAWQAAWRAGRNDLANEMGEAVEEDNRAASASRSEKAKRLEAAAREVAESYEHGFREDGLWESVENLCALLAKYQGE